jgi:hypothetical protein
MKYYKKIESYNSMHEYYFFKQDHNNIDVITITIDNKDKIAMTINHLKYDDELFSSLLLKDIDESTETEYNHALISVQKCINTVKDEFNIF